MGRRERNATPRPGGNRAEKLAARRARIADTSSGTSRPFAGLAAECDLIALRNFVSSATAKLPLAAADAREVRVATVLPGASQALARREGDAVVGYAALQTQAQGGDPASCLAGAVEFAASAAAGDSLADVRRGDLTALLTADATLDVTVHTSFDWWIAEGVQPDPQTAELVQNANSFVQPAARLDAGVVGAPWWADTGSKAHVRWVHPADEDELMRALARVHAAGGLTLGEGSRFAGSFRADGVLVPVFDVDRESHPNEWVPGTVALGERLTEALADDSELTAEQRRSRDGIRGRQVSI
ncbi:DUF5926 family protein [Tsukamurella soli]|uniref:DUF5926 family protein n=1 Tax=Tsukamurella soli TaxID=644556 RepID=A0ABP8KD53_9ACTN